MNKKLIVTLPLFLLWSLSYANPNAKKCDNLFKSKEYGKALSFCEKAVKSGDAQSLYNLGSMYFDGNGVVENPYFAVELFQKSANKGNPDGYYGLGAYYNNLKYYNTNYYSKSEKFFKKSYDIFQKQADKGNAYAQWRVATMYLNGTGVKQDTQKSLQWYEKAAEQGNLDAQINLGDLYSQDLYVIKDIDKAKKFYKLACDNKSKEACDSLKELQ